MWTDNTLTPIADGDDYTHADGTYYPPAFPKAEIPGLVPVTETPRPDETDVVVTGFTIGADLVQVWQTEPRPAKSPEEVAAEARAKLEWDARMALDRADKTALRCFEAGVAFPIKWRDYKAALRAIVSGAQGPLPPVPDYPLGT